MASPGTYHTPNPRLITDSDNSQLDGILDFLVQAVQLTPTQCQDAEQKYGAVARWLSAEGSTVRILSPQIYSQGSLRIDTTVRPLGADEFDLDLVCQLSASAVHTPSEVYGWLWSRMESNERYKLLLKAEPRCIRINYAGDFHLDIVPAIPEPGGSSATSLLIPDREMRTWHPSNPKGPALQDGAHGRLQAGSSPQSDDGRPHPRQRLRISLGVHVARRRLLPRWRHLGELSGACGNLEAVGKLGIAWDRIRVLRAC